MIGADMTVTVVNSFPDSETGYDTYHATVIHGVHWFRRTKTTVGTSGNGGRSGSAGELLAADEVTVRIPVESIAAVGKTMVEKERDYTDPSTQFQLGPGDLLILGAVTVAADARPADLLRGPDAVTVLAVTDSSRAPRAPHYKVVCS